MKYSRRPSLLGGLLWTGLGLLFLLRNFGVGIGFWSLAGRYWPIILILLGLGKVIDYFLKKDAVSIRIGEIIAILALLLIGSAITRVSESHFGRLIRDFPIEIGGSSVRPGQWIESSHTYTEEASYPLDYPVPIRIENSYGMVSIAPGGDREIRVRLNKVIYGNDESSAKNIAGEIRLEAGLEKNESPANLKPEAEPGKKTDAGVFVVKTNREALKSKDYRFNTDMEVFVPKNCQLQVRNSYGEIKASNIEGKIDLSTAQKPLEVTSCKGQFFISNRYAECRLTDLTGNLNLEGRRSNVYVENVKGDVNITDEYSPVEISNVNGKVSVSNTESSIKVEDVTQPVVIEARGTQVTVDNLKSKLKINASHRKVDISKVASDVSLESNYATIALEDVKGNVEINSNSDHISADNIHGYLKLKGRGSEIRANGIKGALDVQTTLKDVIVNDFAGACKVVNEYAGVSLSAKALGQGDVNVKNRNGEINLSLPEGAAFLIDATARNGKVVSEYAGLESPRNSGNAGTLKAKVKTGGPKISLETEYSDIHIRTRGDDGDD